MCARARRVLCAWLWLHAAAAAVAQDIDIGVVDSDPRRAALLAAAVQGGLGEVAAGERAPLGDVAEPGEPLALPAKVCAVCGGGAAAAVCGARGGAGGARDAAAAAARAGCPLLLVQDAAPATAQRWDALQLMPPPELIAEVGAALSAAKGWRHAVLLHAGDAAAAALLAPDPDVLALTARRLPPPGRQGDALLRNLLLVLKRSGAHSNFIVWSGAGGAARVLDAAQRAGLLAERHSYLLLAPDAATQDLEPYSHGGANVTALSLIDPEQEELLNLTRDWRERYTALLPAGDEAAAAEAAAVEASPPAALVLAYLAASIAATALRRLQLPSFPLEHDPCASGRAALHADTLLNYLRSEEWGGAWWAWDGARRGVALHVSELQRGGQLRRVARWASGGGGLQWTRRDPPPPPQDPDAMTNRTFTVLVAKSKPYVMSKESTHRLSGNDRYEGFCIELIERLAKLLHFSVRFEEQEDGDNGKMISRLADPNGGLDFAVTDLTITADREQLVDFTTPFMNLGISILLHKPKPPEPKFFAFMLPFSNDVWVCLGVAYVVTSLVLYCVGRLCPEEWQNPYPCVEDPPALDNQFTLANALWFNLGAMLLQGSEIAPVAYGTRAVAAVWWLFALVITSSYTANLATLLAQKAPNDLIHNVDELANNTFGITYGAKDNGTTYKFFEQSQNPIFKQMSVNMKQWQMPGTNEAGIARVENEEFAFFMESTTIEYTIERNCNVTQVGGLLDSKGYGIAMKKNSAYRQALNLALLNLQESGVLREMKREWWEERHGGGACSKEEERESEKLSMKNFLGLFLVLVVGCTLGVVGACVDLALAARRRRRPGETYARRLAHELRFVFQFNRSVKPARPEPASTESSGSSGEPVEEVAAGAVAGAGSGRASVEGAGSVRRPRRRSSMQAANLRLARHAAAADGGATPTRSRRASPLHD